MSVAVAIPVAVCVTTTCALGTDARVGSVTWLLTTAQNSCDRPVTGMRMYRTTATATDFPPRTGTTVSVPCAGGSAHRILPGGIGTPINQLSGGCQANFAELTIILLILLKNNRLFWVIGLSARGRCYANPYLTPAVMALEAPDLTAPAQLGL